MGCGGESLSFSKTCILFKSSPKIHKYFAIVFKISLFNSPDHSAVEVRSIPFFLFSIIFFLLLVDFDRPFLKFRCNGLVPVFADTHSYMLA